MTNKLKINQFDLLMGFSDALDLISPSVAGHQIRVAYIALEIARKYKLPKWRIKNLIIAACIHDIGAITIKSESIKFDFESNGMQERVGFKYTQGSIFDDASEIIRDHHQKWNNGLGKVVSIESHILHLADRIDTLINKKKYILHQRKTINEKIAKKSGSWFMPELVDCFLQLSANESFWIYTVSENISDILLIDAKLPRIYLNADELYNVTKWFCNIMDFRSRFTSVHSRGVAAVAGAIAIAMKLDEGHVKIIEISGFIHDLGKLAVPNSILEKKGKLSSEEFEIVRSHPFFTFNILSKVKSMKIISEYGAYHHERIDGMGYPFHIKGKDIKLGSRIIAVADIFTALTEKRPYRAAMIKEEVIKIMTSRGDDKELDSIVVKILLDNYDMIDEKRKELQDIANQEYNKFWEDL